ncbi:MAG: DUF4340 domain-containing protein [Anaerolineales bacterium]|jgi:hypothetical protein
MIKRPTWIVLILLVLALGGYFFLKYRSPQKSGTPTPTEAGSTFLLPANGPKLKSVRINDQNNKVTMIERDNNGNWNVSLPAPAPADQAAAEAAETQVGALSIVTKLNTNPPQSAMGLDTPADVIQLVYLDGTQHTLEVGSKTPTSSGYYVRFDHSNLYVISVDGIDPLLEMLDNPPYVPTATPTPPSTSSPSLTPTP